jgi:hypothetical protein
MGIRRLITAGAASAAAVAVGVGMGSTPAQAATKWDLTHSSGNIAGVWGYGTYRWASNGRLYLTVNVKDTAANKKDARVYLRAHYNDGAKREEHLVNGNGSGTTVSITWNFRYDVFLVEARECVDNSLTKKKCAGWSPIVI